MKHSLALSYALDLLMKSSNPSAPEKLLDGGALGSAYAEPFLGFFFVDFQLGWAHGVVSTDLLEVPPITGKPLVCCYNVIKRTVGLPPSC